MAPCFMLRQALNRAQADTVLLGKRLVAQVIRYVLAQLFALPDGAPDGCNLQIKQLGLRQVLAAWRKLTRTKQILASCQSLFEYAG